MSSADDVQAAFDAAVAGDLGPLVSPFAPDLEWRGTTRGHLWWRRTPSWQRPEEARSVLEHRVEQIRDAIVVDPHAQVIAATQASVAVELRWGDSTSSTPSHVFHVLRLRDNKVVDMQDHKSRKAALKAVGEAA